MFPGGPAGEASGAAADGEDPWLQHDGLHTPSDVRLPLKTLSGTDLDFHGGAENKSVTESQIFIYLSG